MSYGNLREGSIRITGVDLTLVFLAMTIKQ